MLLTDIVDKEDADAIFRLAEREEEALRAPHKAVGKPETDRLKTRVRIIAFGLPAHN